MLENFASYLAHRRKFGTIQKVLLENRFDNSDIGPINDIPRVSKFVISIPKCATTAIQKGFEDIGQAVIHAHNDPTTYAAFPNGDRLQAEDIGLAALLRFRRHVTREPVHVFFGYREPIDWCLSLAGHFGLPLNDELKATIAGNCRGASPWNRYDVKQTQKIVEAGTGIKLFEQPFDQEKGYSVRRRGNMNVVIYRFDKMQNLENYIRKKLDRRFRLKLQRVNANEDYVKFVRTFKLPVATLKELYSDRVFSYFYNEGDVARFIARYAEG